MPTTKLIAALEEHLALQLKYDILIISTSTTTELYREREWMKEAYACVLAKERPNNNERSSKNMREIERVCVCVCVCMWQLVRVCERKNKEHVKTKKKKKTNATITSASAPRTQNILVIVLSLSPCICQRTMNYYYYILFVSILY